ncbi:aminomethyl transferase family protein [Trebonia kvetii]|uniref:Aminomethyl transferase family protein n=1 Tax=Trebonia kvetii TaxID=2480626 RepID=A0A6P2BNM3_9ACTN|nr:aminomethyl transferase family protein [Trebonia kvetii]TVZ00659.1 aminomethyl transferase family protein [Trebonia kvetii]
MAGVSARQRETYEALLKHDDGPFITERPAYFSPAAAAQDEANLKGGFGRFAQILLPTEYADGWLAESQAHVRSAYLGDWTSLNKVTVRGRQALDFLARSGLRDLSRFRPGQVTHHVQLDSRGWVASEGILYRIGEEEFVYTAGSCDWLVWQFGQGGWDAEIADISPETFIFGVQGPASLSILERAAGEPLRDIGFSRLRAAQVGGLPVRVLRTGISGELGYELHGSADDADAVWRAVSAAGREYGIRHLGFRSQPVQHIEAGIATNGLDYMPAAAITPGAPRQFRRGAIGGSFVPVNGFTDYFRKPGELGWAPRTLPAHDFLGRDALAADAASGAAGRVLVGLTWHPADVAGVLTALLGDGEAPEQMDIPRLPGPSFDQVLVGGTPAGVSTGRTLSPTVRAMISLCVIDKAHATPGTAVTVIWGRPGTPQREIRATVTALPFKPDNRRTDVTTH